MKHTYSLLFYIKSDKRYTKNEVPIVLRITVNGKRAEQSISKSITHDRWDRQAGKVKGNKEDARAINELIDSISAKINRIHTKLVDDQEHFTASRIRDIYNGVHIQQKTLMEVFTYHNQQIREQIGRAFSLSTYKRYETTLSHVKEFMVKQYGKDDIRLNEIQYGYVTDLEFYLKTQRNCNHNSTLKYIKNFRKIINLAVKND